MRGTVGSGIWRVKILTMTTIEEILENPHESLAIELKDWLDPDICAD
ncbi:MAG: hypothetical protein KJ864_02695 [Candidatus Omnitrophica bacterium]|nr:hypothetical protein [Candidatus Omnitrophota bacterium]